MSGPKSPYNWTEVQKLYDTGVTMRECCRRFGFRFTTLMNAVRRGDFKSRPKPPVLSAKEYGETTRAVRAGARAVLRKKIIKEGIIPYKCTICSRSKWRGKLLTLRLDHINGNGDDHRLENIRWLCPNCDSQQETYCYRNRRRKAIDKKLNGSYIGSANKAPVSSNVRAIGL